MAINTNEITKQMIDFQKTAFNSWYDAVAMMQDQAASAMDTVLNQSGVIPADGSKALDKWGEVFKTNRQNLKKQIDTNFKQAEKIFII
jgi:hypothetical protein